MEISVIDSKRCFGGNLVRFKHASYITKTFMTCSVYLPYGSSEPNDGNKSPCLLYLSGLTCTDENVCQKSGVFQHLAKYKLGFIAPDTSPRNAGIAGESDSWDFGVGAGFYLDSLVEPWSTNYKMYSYVVNELLPVISQNFPALDTTKVGITGHSMGGHGALTIAFKNQNLFQSVSAFAPICNPSVCPWGIKAFSNYLGSDQELWKQYDATELISIFGPTKYDDILIDIGTADNFLSTQLYPEPFNVACQLKNQKVTLRFQEGYDHSYFFISTFIEDHIRFHAQRLLAS